jgi:hypothetical protein
LKVHLFAAALLLAPLSSHAATANNDLNGVWKISKPQSAFVPLDGPIPFTAEGEKAYAQNKAALAKSDFSYDNTQSRCSLPGTPRMSLTPMPFRLWVRPSEVVFEYQWNRQYRTVDMVQPRAVKFDEDWIRVLRTGVTPNPINPPLTGTSLGIGQGHWEGKTLVIESRYFSDSTLIDDLVPHDYDMVVEERWSLIDPKTLRDQITISDPAFFTRPWHTQVTYRRQPDMGFTEDVCLDRHDAGQMPLPITADEKHLR